MGTKNIALDQARNAWSFRLRIGEEYSDCDDHGFNTRQRHRQIKRQRWGQIKGQTQKQTQSKIHFENC